MKLIELSNGSLAKVDDSDYERLVCFNWRFTGHGYAYRTAKKAEPDAGKLISMHRMVLKDCDSKYIDHINGDKLDNRKENLGNRRKIKKASSVYKGVGRQPKMSPKWYARIQVNGKHLFLGYFKTEVEAALAYNKAAKDVFGEFARLNEVIK